MGYGDDQNPVFGEYKTSFSALITRLDKSAISPDEADIDQLSVLTDMAASDQFDDIRTSFLRAVWLVIFA